MDFNQRQDTSPTFNAPNMLPLIDVMLVLLVIVLITSPLISQSVKTDVIGNNTPTKADYTDVALQIDASGNIKMGGKRVSQSQLKVKLTALASQHPELTLRITADQQTTYQNVLRVMNIVGDVNISKIQFRETTPQR